MAGPMQQAGATVEPSVYATLAMDEQFTGLFTQANPIRDAAVPYLIKKFYAGSRFDRIIDGINREITPALTDKRRPGNPVFNSSTFPGVNSYYAWKYIQNAAEVIRLVLDGKDGHIYDFTPNVVGGTGKVSMMSKAAGAGLAAFCGVNTQLFYGDGVSNKKWTQGSKTWAATTLFSPGQLIVDGNKNIQMALGGITLPIYASQSNGTVFTLWIPPAQVPNQLANLEGVNVTFSGLGAAAALNGQTLPLHVYSAVNGVVGVTFAGTPYTVIADTGSGTTGNGITGGSLPSFSSTQFHITADSGQQWKCYASYLQNHGLAGSTIAPTLANLPTARLWNPNTFFVNLTGSTTYYSLLDSNFNIELLVQPPSSSYQTGPQYPQWKAPGPNATQPPGVTADGTAQWLNCGPILAWLASTAVYGYQVILDSNGNLQFASVAGTTDTVAPTWNATLYGTTTDGGVTWVCLGPGTILLASSVQWAVSQHAVDGTVSTASPVVSTQGPVIGQALPNYPYAALLSYFTLAGACVQDPQCDQIWVWRTPQGQSTLILEDQIPIDNFYSGGFTWQEMGMADASTYGNASLNPFIAAPIAKQADPPPTGFLPICFHLGRLWGVFQNQVIYSAGPDAVVGNGNTQFPPNNNVSFIDTAILCFSTTTTQGPTLMVWTTSGLQAIYGQGTPTNPFSDGSSYMARTGILSRFAVDMVGSTLYAMTSTNKLCSYDPSGGYVEIGFPIGDQFTNVTTGSPDAATGALYDPASTYVSWYERNSGDTRLFVSDGAIGWFNFMPTTTPETGGLWNTRAAIVGGTSAVQAIETAPGIFTLLIGPPSGTPGPILMRDPTGAVFGDGAGNTAFPAWDTKGSIGLCDTGEIAEIAHIGLKSRALGARPAVSLLIDEIEAGITVDGETTAFEELEFSEHHEDPPNIDPSITMYSDRYTALQGGGGSGPAPQGPKCDNFQLRIDYGAQTVGDELLKFGIFGAVHKERLQQ